MTVLAYTPFIDPIDAHAIWWIFLLPLSFGIAMAYKAVRLNDLAGYWKQVAFMTAQIVLAMIALGAAAYILLQHVIPMILPME